MSSIHLTVHPPVGEFLTAQLTPSQYTVGSGSSAQVQLPYEGVAEQHVVLWMSEDRMEVEPLVEGVRVNSYPISERVEVPFPVSVEFAGVMLVVELKAVELEVAKPESGEDIQITLPSGESQASLPPALDIHSAPTIVGNWNGPPPRSRSGGRLRMPPPEQKKEASSEAFAPLIGGYESVREIARGGMGKIYFGEDEALERQVAVKVSSLAHGGMDPRFEKEAKVLAKLSHPNIVPIHAKGLDGQGRPYYSMKLVKGRTLQAVLNAIANSDAEVVQEYPLPALLTIFRKVCDAMAFAHSQRILHRDLKPENVMVGEYGEVLVMDWGLAKTLGEKEASSLVKGTVGDTGNYGMTMEGDVMGTPQYMSPEQAEGMVAELDERSDIYSLGGILYAILMLRAPIDGKTLDEVLTKVKSGQLSSMGSQRNTNAPVESPVAVERKVPGALQAVVLKAMSLDRAKRYLSVEAFAADIEAYQNGFATQAEDAGAWKRVKLWVRRNKVLAGSAVAMLFVVSGFTARVVQKGSEASEALRRLRETAPTFAVRAREALREGQFEEALKSATFAVNLESENGEYRALRGNVLQVLVRWGEALEEYRAASRFGAKERAQENLVLTEELLKRAKSEGEAKAKAALFEALNGQGRQYEAMEFGKGLGDFWRDRRKDASALPELVKRLEAKLLPVPGTEVLMSSTEMTVGEWKLYLKA